MFGISRFRLGMGKTGKMTRKRKRNTNRIKTCKKRGVALWSDLNDDVLFLVMMQLGVIDFLAFSGVCKSWRSHALSNREKFLASKTPMSISFTTDANGKECCLEDFEGRKFKTTLPHSTYKTCIGVTCGYLIFGVEETNYIWLVNLITRHELHFPDVPDEFFCCPRSFKGTLVFSPSISEWVLVVLSFCTNNIWISIASKRGWTKVHSSAFSIFGDLQAFKGKIYIIDYPCVVEQWKLRLYPKPKLVFLKTWGFQRSDVEQFVNSGENLYVMDLYSDHPHTNLYELDFGKSKWIHRKKTGDKYAFFTDNYKCRTGTYRKATIVLRESSVDLRSLYGRYLERYLLTDKQGKGGFFHTKLWYFFHDCLNVNLLEE